jgi:replicative DNA helicase
MAENRVPPNNLDAEAAVLSACLLAPESFDEIQDILKPADFYADANRQIYETIRSLNVQGQPSDVVTVAAVLRDSNKLDRIGGASYLAQLSDATPAVAHIEAHARLVVEKARQRRLIAICQRHAVEGYSVENIDDWAQELEREVFDVAHTDTKTDPAEPLSELAPAVLGDIKQRVAVGGQAPGLDTGWTSLTNTIGGWEDSQVYVVAGRPGMGKSSVMLGACLNVARKHFAVFVSAEMPKDQLASRALAVEANLNVADLRSGKLKDGQWATLVKAAERLRKHKLWIDYKSGATVGAIKSSIRKASAKQGERPRLIAIDYLQILNGDRQKGDSREAQVAGIMRGVLSIAAEFECPVLLGSQLNRGVESRTVKDKRPALGDLRESGAIEQDAYGVIMLYRDEYYNPGTEEPGVIEFNVAKNRNGGPKAVKLHFTADSTRISNLESEKYAEHYDIGTDPMDGQPW